MLIRPTDEYEPSSTRKRARVGIESTSADQSQDHVRLDYDEEDPLRPLTWSFRALFELYVFADSYDTLALRQQVIQLIQVKLMMVTPRKYANPPISAISWVVDNLPSSSPLRKFLAGFVGKDLGLTALGSTKSDFVKQLAKLPGDFLAECLVASKAQSQAEYDNDSYDPDSQDPGFDCDGVNIDDDLNHELFCDVHTHHEHEKDTKQAVVGCRVNWREILGPEFCDWETAQHDLDD